MGLLSVRTEVHITNCDNTNKLETQIPLKLLTNNKNESSSSNFEKSLSENLESLNNEKISNDCNSEFSSNSQQINLIGDHDNNEISIQNNNGNNNSNKELKIISNLVIQKSNDVTIGTKTVYSYDDPVTINQYVETNDTTTTTNINSPSNNCNICGNNLICDHNRENDDKQSKYI